MLGTSFDKSLGCTYHNVFHVFARSSVGARLQAVDLLLSIKMAADEESKSITPTALEDEDCGEHDAEQTDDTRPGKATKAAGKDAKAGPETAQGGQKKGEGQKELIPMVSRQTMTILKTTTPVARKRTKPLLC